METEIKFIKLEKILDSYIGNYIGISKQKNGNFLLVFRGKENKNEIIRDVITITENMKLLLRNANKAKDLVMDCEIRIKLLQIIDLKTPGHTYKKYEFT